jgi:ribosomal protein S4E
MKVRCIKSVCYKSITIGKIYDVISINEDLSRYRILNDNNQFSSYLMYNFIEIKKERSEKISLLINMFD